jgi:methionyl aminopeptidase
MKTNNSFYLNSEFVLLHGFDFLKDQKYAGRCVASVLKSCGDLIRSNKKNISLKDFEKIADLYCRVLDCIPTFKGYKGFPSSLCVSVNNQLVHGIATDYILQDGDIVSCDFGATFNGAVADAARTWIYGIPKSQEHVRMLSVCRKALDEGSKSIKVGNKVGCIGYAINNVVKNSGFGLINNYGGHGISCTKDKKGIPHSNPFIFNKSLPNEGIVIQNGLSIAIEPMITIGSNKTKVLDDGWTVITEGMNCHFENTYTVINGEVYIITEIPNEEYLNVNRI